MNELENNLKQMKHFKDQLNEMSNWIENLNLDLLKQQQTSSSSPLSSKLSSKSSTPSPTPSLNNLLDKHVSFVC
jgi:hypothetical protein